MAKSARSKSKKAFRNIKKCDQCARVELTSRSTHEIMVRSCFYDRDQVKQSPLYLENEARKEASQAQAVVSGQQAHEQVLVNLPKALNVGVVQPFA